MPQLFDQVAEAVDEGADLLAERIVQLGRIAQGTMRVATKASVLPVYPLDISDSRDHVAALSKSLAAYGKLVRELIDPTDQLGDKDAADLCTEVWRGVDQMLGFVEAHNQ